MIAKTQKNTLLQAAQANAKVKACKRVFFSSTQEEFSPPLFFLFFFSLRTGTVHNLTGRTSKLNSYGQVTANLTQHHFGQTEARTDNMDNKSHFFVTIFADFLLSRKFTVQLVLGLARLPAIKILHHHKLPLT